MSKGKLPISITIIAKNEGPRIEAAILSVLSFASEVIVVDSNSIDDTAAIAKGLGAHVHKKNFAGFGQQKNFAQKLCANEWVLNIDADERVPAELDAELRAFFKDGSDKKFDGAYLPRKTWYFNRWVMHGGWYPNYLLRFARRSKAKWSEPHIHEELRIDGEATHFKQPLEHYSFPSQRSHILKNVEYAAHACANLKSRQKTPRIVDITFKPLWKFFDGYILKRGFMDGFAGFFIAIHSAYALFLRYTYLYEQTAQSSRPRQ